MKYIHSKVSVDDGDSILVSLKGTEAVVRVMTDDDFRRYRAGTSFTFLGGRYTKSPVVIDPPSAGRWNVVIDFGGHAGKVGASVSAIHRNV